MRRVREPQLPLSCTRDAPRYGSTMVTVAVAEWVWMGLIFAVVLLGVAALARRA